MGLIRCNRKLSMPQDGPENLPKRPRETRTIQETPLTLPRPLKTAPRRAKTPPRRPQDDPKTVWSVVMAIAIAIAIAIAPRPKSRENGWELNQPPGRLSGRR